MIKVRKCECNKDVDLTNLDTFTKGEVYFVRESKKGRTVVRSNEGRWVVIGERKMSLVDHALTYFDEVEVIFFKSFRELRRLSV